MFSRGMVWAWPGGAKHRCAKPCHCWCVARAGAGAAGRGQSRTGVFLAAGALSRNLCGDTLPRHPEHHCRYKIFGAPQVVSLTSSAMTVAPIGIRSSRGKAIIFPILAPPCTGAPPWCRLIWSAPRCWRSSGLTIRPRNKPASNTPRAIRTRRCLPPDILAGVACG